MIHIWLQNCLILLHMQISLLTNSLSRNDILLHSLLKAEAHNLISCYGCSGFVKWNSCSHCLSKGMLMHDDFLESVQCQRSVLREPSQSLCTHLCNKYWYTTENAKVQGIRETKLLWVVLTVRHCIISGWLVSGAAPWFDSTASET